MSKKNNKNENKEKMVRSINKNVRSSVRKLNPILRSIIGKKVDNAIKHLKDIGLPTSLPKSFKKNTTLKKFVLAMKKDKKVKRGKINLILLKKIGKAFITNKFPEEKLNKVILSQLK